MSILFELRDYQSRITSKTRQVVAAGSKRPLVVAPTGAGKTHIATAITQMGLDKGSTVQFFAPRRDLIYQTLDKFVSYGIHSGMIMAGESRDMMAPVQITSFDTLHARAMRSDKMAMPKSDIVIVDEAHLSISRSRRKILDYYTEQGSIIVGTHGPCV